MPLALTEKRNRYFTPRLPAESLTWTVLARRFGLT